MKRSRALLSGSVVLLCLVGAFTFGFTTVGGAASPQVGSSAGPGEFPTNDAGQSYGSDFGSKVTPDLILARGDHGKSGYVKATEVYYDPVKTLEDAQRLAEEPAKPRVINLYSEDGKTVIDTFTLPVSVETGPDRK